MSHLDPAELETCLPGLYRYANSLTRNNDQALDLVQDCVERALNKSHLFDGVNLRAWLTTICRRLFLNEIRKRKSRGVDVLLDDAHAGWGAVDAEQDIKLQYKSVIGALSTLSANDQKVILMIAFEGLKYREAAKKLAIPTGTVRSRLSRARSRLLEAADSQGVRIPSELAPVIQSGVYAKFQREKQAAALMRSSAPDEAKNGQQCVRAAGDRAEVLRSGQIAKPTRKSPANDRAGNAYSDAANKTKIVSEDAGDLASDGLDQPPC